MPQIDIRSALEGHEFIKEWLRYIEPFEYPDSFSIFGLLAMAACAVDKRILINSGAKPETWTNIYVLLYGPSGSRKSEALLDAFDLLASAFPEAPVFPMNFTMEALRNRMHKDSEEFGKTSGLILVEELSTLLGGRDYLLSNSLFLGKIWEGRKEETFLTVAHQDQIIKEGYVTLGACATPEAFGDLDPRGLSAGFLRRIMIISEKQAKRESDLPVLNTRLFNTILVPRFRDRFEPSKIDPKGVLMQLSPDAKKLNREWYQGDLREMRKRHVGPREGHFIGTLQVHAFKIAALLHLLDGGDPQELSEGSLKRGFDVVGAILPGTFEAYNALVPSFFARVCMVVRRIAASGPIKEGVLDAAVKAEIGATPEQAAAARMSLLTDGILTRSNGTIGVR